RRDGLLIIAGLSLKNLKPRVWDSESPHFIPELRAVMVSYAEFHAMPAWRTRAMKAGIHKFLGVPKDVKVYLDNGAFYFLTREGRMPKKEYEKFVDEAQPDWYPIPREFIPHPAMRSKQQEACYSKTMAINREYQH